MKLKMSFSFWVGSSLVGLLLILALITPWLPLQSPTAQDLSSQFSSPSRSHWLGLGENGVDLLSQILWGARLSLFVGFGTVIFSGLIGILIGSIAGYLRGQWDKTILRAIEIIQSFPGILLVITLTVVLGPNVYNMMIAMTATAWASYARLARSVTLSLRERDFVVAAQALGAKRRVVLVKHIWPNLVAPLIVQMTYGVGAAIMTESTLSFLGVGAPIGTPSWGQMLNQGREVLTSATHVIAVPSVALFVTILGLNLFGDGLRDLLDPKMVTKF